MVGGSSVGVAQPYLVLLVGEGGVELVDGGGEQCLLTPRRPVHRVQRDAAEDPGGVVAHELRVGQRPDDEPRRVQLVEQREEAAVHLIDHVLVGDAANEELRQPIRRQLGQPGPDLVGEPRSDQIVGHLAIQQPLAGVGLRHDVGEQVLKLEDLDTAVDHLGDEVEVVAAGLLQPDDIVEQQLVAVVRGEPLMGQARRADHDSPQPARLRPDAEPGFGRVHRTERLPVAISTAATTDVTATTATTTSSGLVNAGKRLSLRAQRYSAVPTR